MTEYATCKTCGLEYLRFSLVKGECFYCTSALELKTEHDPDCKICKEARDGRV